jgi:GxxExxY protein
VNDLVIVEVKSVEEHHPIYERQLLTYLRQTDKHLGLVINFGAEKIKEGIHRVANKLPD